MTAVIHRRWPQISLFFKFLRREGVPKCVLVAQYPQALFSLYAYSATPAKQRRRARSFYSSSEVQLASPITGHKVHYHRSYHQREHRRHSLLSTMLSEQYILKGRTAFSVKYEMHSRIDLEHRVALWRKKRKVLPVFLFLHYCLALRTHRAAHLFTSTLKVYTADTYW